MPTKLNSISEAAAIVGIAPSTLRHWVKQFAAHMSDHATPPAGQERLLTDRDVAILQRVAELRAQHKPYADIAIELATLPPDEALTPYIDVSPQDAPLPPDVALQTVALVNTALGAFGERMSKLEAAQKENASRIWYVLAGVVIGILLTVAAIVALQAGVWFGR